MFFFGGGLKKKNKIGEAKDTRTHQESYVLSAALWRKFRIGRIEPEKIEEDLTLTKKGSLPQREKEKGNSNPELRCESDAAGFFQKCRADYQYGAAE